MSLKNKFISTITLALAVFASTATIAAQDKPQKGVQKQEKEGKMFGRHKFGGEGFRGKRGGMLRGLHRLNLTDAQREQIRSIMQQKRAGFESIREELHTLKKARHEGALTAEQETRLKAIKEQMRANAAQTKQEVLNVLTPDQRSELENIKEEMRRKREERKQMRMQKQTAPK